MMPAEALEAALASGSLLALPLAFVGGVLVALNPCCLPFYPAVAAACCTSGVADRGRATAWAGGAFACGTAFATTTMGVAAALAGHALSGFGRWPRYALAFVPIVMGLHLMQWLRLPMPAPAGGRRASGLLAAFTTGMLLALVVGSCGTPVLAAILAYAAYQGKVAAGAGLLLFYGLGNGAPVLIAGTGAGELARRAGTSAAWIERLAGAALVSLGYYLILTVP